MGGECAPAEAVWICDDRTLWRRASGDLVVFLAPDAEAPQLLEGSGARLWQLLCSGTTIDEAVSVLAPPGAPTDPVRSDLAAVFGELSDLGAIRSAS